MQCYFSKYLYFEKKMLKNQTLQWENMFLQLFFQNDHKIKTITIEKGRKP